MNIPEYDDLDPLTWYAIHEADVIGDAESKAFDAELLRIGGTTPDGRPMLVKRWCVDYPDPMKPTSTPKYLYVVKNPTLIGFEFTDEAGSPCFVERLEDVPASVLIPIPKYNNISLGERRWIIEQWHSPEFLRRSGRYEMTHDDGEAEVRVSCKNCGSLNLKPTGREDEHVCLDCNSTRQSVVIFNEVKHERLLHDFPERGCYDYFLRLETANGLYHPADGEALEGIRRLWKYQQKPLIEQERDNEKVNQLAARDRNRRINEIWAN